ncbi:kxDL motif-containing protein CG10681 isoform X2 [Copidosoma floridanum]|uniref:kxDL motif-containing protein CG10681 isoform X2 n=1 Tax=Copidosoma floridanum TaxID=29053 RepID=UPI000C6F7BB4|nr:kxDL motif-containing protein CG10681 isoform X2 [Copidosoma floridanum]
MAAGNQVTPESEAGSFECFQNYTAPEVFVQGLAGIVDQQDVESMIRAQKEMLQRFEKTNEMLTNCNQLSINRLKTSGAEIKKHTALLTDMKKDLDFIFKKIRVLKTKLSQQHPQAYNEAVRSSLAEEVIVDEVEQRPKSAESEVPPQPQSSSSVVAEDKTDVMPEFDEAQFADINERLIMKKDSSSTETEIDLTKPGTSSGSSDTS